MFLVTFSNICTLMEKGFLKFQTGCIFCILKYSLPPFVENSNDVTETEGAVDGC